MTHSAHVLVKLRTPDGHICGEGHHRSRWPDAVVAMALDLHEQLGHGAHRVAVVLRRRGYAVPDYTVKSWLDGSRRALLRRW